MNALPLGVFCLVSLRWETGEESKTEISDEDAHHDDCADECCLGLCAIADDAFVVCHGAGLGDVPWWPVLRMFGIAGV